MLPLELVEQERLFVAVAAMLVTLGIAPDFRVLLGDVAGQEAAEDRVARERRRGGENAVVERLLQIEERRGSRVSGRP